jgi:hypothetical protein
MRDLEAKQARQTLSIEEETKAKKLQLADDALGAELKRIEAGYAEKYASADAANKKLLLEQEKADKDLARQNVARKTEAATSDVRAREMELAGKTEEAVVERARQKYTEALRAAGKDQKAREAAGQAFMLDVATGIRSEGEVRSYVPTGAQFHNAGFYQGQDDSRRTFLDMRDRLTDIVKLLDPQNQKAAESSLDRIVQITIGG